MGMGFEARWEDALPDYINHVRSCRAPRTVDYYRTTLAQLYDWTAERGIGLNDMTRKRMEEYINYRADKGLAANTIHHDKVVARAFFRFARQEGYIKGRPLQNLDMRKPAPVERYCPTEEDIAALLEAVPRKWRIRSNPGVA
jgi:site-specific recombinase XerD